MMGGALSGRAIFGTQPNVLFDASNYSKGQNDALAIQKNRLMLDRAQMENANDKAFRSAAPGAIGGDPAAMTAAVAADPDRALALQTQLASLDSGRRKKALESMTILGQGAASLLNLPDDQAATTYPTLLERFKGMGIDTSALPPAYPGRAAVETFARGLTPIMDQLKAQDERIVPAGDGANPYQPIVEGAAQRHGVSPNLVNAVIQAESGGRPDAVSPKGAQGLMQIMPATGKELGLADPRDPGQNIDKGTQYLSQMIQRYGGDQAMGLIAYNWGPGNTDAWIKRGANPAELPAETQAYVRGIGQRLQQASQPRQMVKAGTGMPVTAGGAQYVQNADGSTGFQALPAKPAPSDGRLPPGVMIGPDGRRTKDDAYIQAQREIAAGKAEATPPKRIPATIQKMDDEDITAIQTARALEKDISDIGAMLDDGKFSTGFMARAGYGIRGAFDSSTQEGRDFATFKATVEKIRNESLRLNKGVQTEGDAVRAGNELVANINDTATVRQRLQELAAINQRAAGLTALKLNRRRVENGLPEVDEDQIVNAPSVLSGARQGAAPPQSAVDHLRRNPGLRDAFDQKYGAGASDRALAR